MKQFCLKPKKTVINCAAIVCATGYENTSLKYLKPVTEYLALTLTGAMKNCISKKALLDV